MSGTEMKRPKYPPPFSPEQIERYAASLRRLVGMDQRRNTELVLHVENGLSDYVQGFYLEICPQRDRDEVEAYTDFDPARIVVREDVYEKACLMDSRSCFTLAHELGHLCLHFGYARPRLAPRLQKIGRSHANRRLEDEANYFAGAFLMPFKLAKQHSRTPHLLAQLCNVSHDAACQRIEQVARKDGHTKVDNLLKLFQS